MKVIVVLDRDGWLHTIKQTDESMKSLLAAVIEANESNTQFEYDEDLEKAKEMLADKKCSSKKIESFLDDCNLINGRNSNLWVQDIEKDDKINSSWWD